MALVSKILEATLAAGSTSVTFTDSDIPNSLIRVYSSDSTIIPESRILSGTSLTVIYAPQTNAIGVAVEIVKQGLDIVDDLISTDTDKALSAKQGKTLKDLIDAIVIPTVPENITDLDDVDVNDIENGQVLAWDEVSEKFINVNQSGGTGGVNYSTEEQDTGLKWIDNKPIYQKTFSIPTTSNPTTYSVSSLNIDKCISIEGFMMGSGGVNIPGGYWYSNTNYVSIYYYTGDIYIDAPTQNGNTPCIVTIRYTKGR